MYSEECGLSGHVIRFSIKSQTRKFGQWARPIGDTKYAGMKIMPGYTGAQREMLWIGEFRPECHVVYTEIFVSRLIPKMATKIGKVEYYPSQFSFSHNSTW